MATVMPFRCCHHTLKPAPHGRKLERRDDGLFVGYSGLAPVPAGLPVSGIEAGWGLVRSAWGFGYAAEASRAAVLDGFDRFGFDEIIAFAADSNRRSQAVMGRAGLLRDAARDFDHPGLAPDHPLRPHIVYHARKPG